MMESKNLVTIYCDGACSSNPGPGAFAAVLVCRGHTKEISGFVEQTTNNRMELTAALEGLSHLDCPCQVTVVSDSKYLVNGGTGEWGISTNLDLWRALNNVARNHEVNWLWGKGHSGHALNSRADRLARVALAKGMLEKRKVA